MRRRLIKTAKKDIDVFGFDELEKAFNRCKKKYDNDADALLMAQGRQVNKRTKELSPIYKGKISPSKQGKLRPGQLKRSWRLKAVKEYQNGRVKVVRIQSTAPHAHLIELGHEIVRGGKTRVRGRRLNAVQRSARGISSGGNAEGKHMLENALKEAQSRFGNSAEKILDSISKEWDAD